MSDVYQRMERAEFRVVRLRRRLAKSQEQTLAIAEQFKLAVSELKKRDAMVVELLATMRGTGGKCSEK